jgi:Flp pilus assembly protein TadG
MTGGAKGGAQRRVKTVNKINALLQRGLKKIWASKSGAVLIYIAFALPILLGVMALSVDLGRAFILNTELKDFSDAAALAGAAELDGRDGARAAAESAARTGLQGTMVNIQAFATDGDGPSIVVDDVVFLQRLPRDGTDFVPSDTATTDAEARFIFVSVVNRDVRSGLSRALGVIPEFNTTAKSIAGFSSVVCRLPSMFMCNPLEGDGTDHEGITVPQFPLEGTNCWEGGYPSQYTFVGAPLNEDCLVGRMMKLKNGGGGGNGNGSVKNPDDNTIGTKTAYFPGEFGLLGCPEGIFDSPGNSKKDNQGIQCVAETIAQAEPNVCISTRAFPQTGQGAGPIRQAIGVRFDLYEQPMFGDSGQDPAPGNRNYRPSLNNTKGHAPDINPGNGSCSTDKSTEINPSVDADMLAANVMPFPRDPCFYGPPGTCSGDRFGPGNWHDDTVTIGPTTSGFSGSRAEVYWEINHPGEAPPDGYADMTRYEVYRHEINSMNYGAVPNDMPGVPRPDAGAVEEARACNYQLGDSADPDMGNFSDPSLDGDDKGPDEIDRRVLVLAAVNCREHGPLHGAQPDGIPTIGFVEVFLTEPATQGGPESLHVWGEIKGILDDSNEGVRDIVQLYR